MGEVARHLAVSVAFISDVERLRRAPLNPEHIRKVATFIGCDAHELLHAAAAERGAIKLRADSPKALEVGTTLSRVWDDLTEDEFEKLRELLERTRK